MADLVFQSLYVSAGMLWKALWALMFGYIISSGIQAIVTRSQMAAVLGKPRLKDASLAAFFGFVSSSCSFAALAASRSVWAKGAHPKNAIAFLIASTNLVIELGIVLWVLLGWKFFIANFTLGILMIIYAYLLSGFYFPEKSASKAQEKAIQFQENEMENMTLKQGISALGRLESWQIIAKKYFMEWEMVYKEVLFGFIIAGVISTFVPDSFWSALFLKVETDSIAILSVFQNALVSPFVAFFTFIGSMGNVPLAAMLWSKDVSFAGVMSFLGADLVAATVVYIHHKYYGWKYTLYLSLLLYACMVFAGVTTHYLFYFLNILPETRPSLQEIVRFKLDYTFWLNMLFLGITAWLWFLRSKGKKDA